MKGKSLIVYYSLFGNTEVAAKEIHEQTKFDILRLEEKKERNKDSVMAAAMGGVFGLKSSLKQVDFSLKDYDNLFIGTQVWAGKTTPAINTYLSKANLKNKNVYIFITKADPKVPQKVIDSVTKRVEKRGGKVLGSTSITTKWQPKKDYLITQEEIKEQIQQWISSLE